MALAGLAASERPAVTAGPVAAVRPTQLAILTLTSRFARGRARSAPADNLARQVCAVLIDRKVADFVDNENSKLPITTDLAHDAGA